MTHIQTLPRRLDLALWRFVGGESWRKGAGSLPDEVGFSLQQRRGVQAE
jgi:hypothetical protein